MNLEKVTVARADGQGQVGHFRSPSADTYLQLNVNVEFNRTYTLHGYIKSAANGTLSCLGKSVGTTTSWNHFSMQIVPDSKIFSLVFSPGEYWFYNFKLEKGTIMTQWTPNGEDLVVVKQNIVSMGSSINQLNDKITQKVWMTEVNAAKGEVNAHLTNVEQTANKIDWLVKSGTDASNMVLTDNAYSLIAKNIDLKGNATFSSFLDTDKTYINGGKIATGSITADQITAGAITSAKIAAGAITAEKIATDAIKSNNYVANSTGSYLNLKDGTFDSKNFKIDSSGDVSVTGKINATSGSFKGIIQSDNPNTLYSTEIRDGNIYFYGSKNNSEKLLTGQICSWKWMSENYSMLGISVPQDATGFSLNIKKSGKGYNLKYLLNNGENPNGITDTHIWYDSECHTGIAQFKNYVDILDSSLRFYTTQGSTLPDNGKNFVGKIFGGCTTSGTYNLVIGGDVGDALALSIQEEVGYYTPYIFIKEQGLKQKIEFKQPTYIYDLHLAKSAAIDSDRRLKKDITSLNINKSSEFIYSLNPVLYKYKENNSNRFHHGLIAQELKQSMGNEDWGVYVDNSFNKSSSYPMLGICYEELIPDLIATLQSQNNRIKFLETQIPQLQNQILQLQNQLSNINGGI